MYSSCQDVRYRVLCFPTDPYQTEDNSTEGRLEVATNRKLSRFGIDGIISTSLSTLVLSTVGFRRCTATSRTSLELGPMLLLKH